MDEYTIDDAIKVVNKMKHSKMKAGIVGSIIKSGFSEHDIDITVVCGDLPKDLIEDELFDYISKGISECQTKIERIFNTKLYETGTEQGFPQYLFGYVKVDDKVIPVDFIPVFEGEEEEEEEFFNSP